MRKYDSMDQKIIIHGDKKTNLVQNNSMICSNNNIYTDKPNLKSNVKNTNIVDPNIIGVIKYTKMHGIKNYDRNFYCNRCEF